MRESSKAALGGITASAAVAVMLCTYISPFLVYTAPPFAGLLLIVIVNEAGFGRAAGTYFTVSFLSLFLIADKESAVLFCMFFGYFPIISLFLEKKLHCRFLRFILKFLIFNFSLSLSLIICMYIFGIEYDDFSSGGRLFKLLFAVMMNLLFLIYNILVIKIQRLYTLKFHSRIQKLFRH